jgi:hypothetical protein
MYELIRAGERSYYIDCPAKIGLYDTGDGVCLIDSGNDKDAGRKVSGITGIIRAIRTAHNVGVIHGSVSQFLVN